MTTVMLRIMATFTAKDVSELRQRTGAGMMECKKALEENNGDLGKAVEALVPVRDFCETV